MLASSLASSLAPLALLLGGVAATGCGEVESGSQALDCAAIPGVVACNNFEAEDAAWTTLAMNGTATLSDADSVTGAKALLAQVTAMGGKAVRTRGIEAADRYYARFYAMVPAGSDTTGVALMHLGETSGQFLGTNVEISGGMLGAAVQSADLYEYPTAMPLDRWVCLELDLTVSDTAGRVLVRADGTAIFDRSGIDTKPVGPIGDLEVGISYAGAAGASAMIDDLVVARQPLTACP